MTDPIEVMAHEIIDERGYSVQKVLFKDKDGKECYAVLLMSQSVIEGFKKAYTKGNINLEEWGKVLFTGYGKQIPELEELFIDEVFKKQG